MHRNYDYYKDPTAREAIKRSDKGKKRSKPWGGRLTYKKNIRSNYYIEM